MAAPFGAQSTTDEVLAGIDLSGKRVLVTGASAGLGVETARALAAHGARVVGAVRDLKKGWALGCPWRNAAVGPIRGGDGYESRSWLASAALAAALAAAGANASAYSAVYAFGDSLSDAGNFYIFSGNPANHYDQSPFTPYVNHEFSNGAVAVQYLSTRLGDGPLKASLSGGGDFAYSGAHTGATPISAASPVDLPAQWAQFSAAHPGGAPSTALYTLDIGTNDIILATSRYEQGRITLPVAQSIISAAAENVASFAAQLLAAGARQLLLFLAPDVGTTPKFNTDPDGALATELSQQYNEALLADLGPIETDGLEIYTVNVFAFQDAAIARPNGYGFTDVRDPCWTGAATKGATGALCATNGSAQNRYLFWDSVHTTTAADYALATAALKALANGPIGAPAVQAASDGRLAVPEPAAWLLMIAGMVGVGARLRRRPAKSRAEDQESGLQAQGSHIVALAQRHALLAQNVVGGGGVKMQIGQGE